MAAQNPTRKFQLPLSEMIDRLTITQIKLSLLKDDDGALASEIEMLSHDIDLIMQNSNIELSSQLARAIVQISQINLHIWHNKDAMQSELDNEPEYLRLLKLSHQLNGIRNAMKNYLVELEGGVDSSHKRTNFETDGLNWNYEID